MIIIFFCVSNYKNYHISHCELISYYNIGTEISGIIKLAAFLRWISGGSFLDISFGYELPIGTLYTMFAEVAQAIDVNVDNINFPIDDPVKLKGLEADFAKISGGRFRGTVAAGDYNFLLCF